MARQPDPFAGALQPYRGERSAFAFQLDLYYRLAVRMALAGSDALELIQHLPERRQRLETVLIVPHAEWLNHGVTEIVIQDLARAAVQRFAPDLDVPKAPASAGTSAVESVFAELGAYLSNTVAFYARLDELKWSDRYQPVGKTFQEQAPLIADTGASWRFNYDRTGRGLTAALESEKVPYGGGDWMRDTVFIRDVVSALKELAGP